MASLSATAPPLRREIGTGLARLTAGTAVATLLACSVRIATAATADPRYLVPSGRRTGYPAWMRGPLHGLNSGLHLHTFVLLMGVMVAAWMVLLLVARALPGWALAAVILAATAIFTLAPPLLSTDVFNYIAYGVMGTHGINPYSHGPIVLLGQPLYGYTGHLWKHVPSAYGPAFTLLTYALAPLGVAGAFWTLKALTGAALLAMAGLVWLAARKLGRDPRLALVLVALNPLVLVYGVGGAHNDLIMAAVLAAALYLAVAARPAAAGAVAVAAIAVKASAGLALPFFLLGSRPRLRTLAGAAGAALVTAAVSFAVFGGAIVKMAGALAMQQHFNWIVVSVPGFVAYYLGLGHLGHTAHQLLIGVAAAAVVVLLARARGGRGWIEGAGAALLVLLATTAWVLPWYVVWALPFAALARGRAVAATAVVLTAVLMAMQLDHFVLTHGSHHGHRVAAASSRHRH